MCRCRRPSSPMDGQRWLIYELHLENSGAAVATLTSVEVADPATPSDPLAVFVGDGLISRLDVAADRQAPLSIPAGQPTRGLHRGAAPRRRAAEPLAPSRAVRVPLVDDRRRRHGWHSGRSHRQCGAGRARPAAGGRAVGRRPSSRLGARPPPRLLHRGRPDQAPGPFHDRLREGRRRRAHHARRCRPGRQRPRLRGRGVGRRRRDGRGNPRLDGGGDAGLRAPQAPAGRGGRQLRLARSRRWPLRGLRAPEAGQHPRPARPTGAPRRGRRRSSASPGTPPVRTCTCTSATPRHRSAPKACRSCSIASTCWGAIRTSPQWARRAGAPTAPGRDATSGQGRTSSFGSPPRRRAVLQIRRSRRSRSSALRWSPASRPPRSSRAADRHRRGGSSSPGRSSPWWHSPTSRRRGCGSRRGRGP